MTIKKIDVVIHYAEQTIVTCMQLGYMEKTRSSHPGAKSTADYKAQAHTPCRNVLLKQFWMYDSHDSVIGSHPINCHVMPDRVWAN